MQRSSETVRRVATAVSSALLYQEESCLPPPFGRLWERLGKKNRFSEQRRCPLYLQRGGRAPNHALQFPLIFSPFPGTCNFICFNPEACFSLLLSHWKPVTLTTYPKTCFATSSPTASQPSVFEVEILLQGDVVVERGQAGVLCARGIHFLSLWQKYLHASVQDSQTFHPAGFFSSRNYGHS